MRVRLSKPPLSLMIVIAALVGVIFYFYDNRQMVAPTQATPISAQRTVASTAVIVPPTPTNTNTSIASTRFIQAQRQELPEDVSIFVPAVGIISDVIQAYFDGSSWDVSQLRSRVGHLEGTPWVTQPGNVVMSGHVELANGLPGIFSQLNTIEIGDVINIESDGALYIYVVVETYSTVPTDTSLIKPTAEDRLTLITCGSYNIISNAYDERFIVIAERVNNDD